MTEVLRGKYRITREIARSNDIVYEAEDVTLGRRIALKELNVAPGITGQARRERIERFQREARAAGRLSHPNIVSVFEHGEENGRFFIAMEFLEGQNLRDQMQARGAYPLHAAVAIISQVLDALQYAHTHGVIHRDIKPDNIQILPGGTVKITDFGIARLTEEVALTSDGQVFGTPSYMSPEQIEGRNIDHRSDLFSVGVVLYEMLMGRKPFIGDSVISITYAIMNQEPQQMPGVPTGIEQVIRRALAKNPLQRQLSADQMKLDLRNAEQTPAVFLPPQNPTGMNRTGQGYGYHNTGNPPYPPQQPAYPPPPSYPAAGGYAPPPPQYPAQMPPQMPPPMQDPGLPWVWNGQGQTGMAGAPVSQQIPPAGRKRKKNAPPPFNPYAAPPFQARPPEPLITLSPGAKSFLLAITVATIVGVCIAFGVIGFLRSYDQYKVTAGSQAVSTLINQGVADYNAKNYEAAVRKFEQARAANPGDREKAMLAHNLASAYIQIARIATTNSQPENAQTAYKKALEADPDNKIAHDELARLLERTGQPEAASREREAARNSPDTSASPRTAEPSASPTNTSSGTSPPPNFSDKPIDSQTLFAKNRAEARELIAEGDRLARDGRRDEAEEKYRAAETKATGFPERDEAKRRIEQLTPQNNDQ